MDYLDRFEEGVNEAEAEILSSNMDNQKETLEKIIAWRRELLRVKRYYEQLSAIFDELADNDNQLLTRALRKRILILGSRGWTVTWVPCATCRRSSARCARPTSLSCPSSKTS